MQNVTEKFLLFQTFSVFNKCAPVKLCKITNSELVLSSLLKIPHL